MISAKTRSANGNMLPKNDMTREGAALRFAAKAQKETEMRLAYDNTASPVEQSCIMVTGYKRPLIMATNNDAKNIVQTSNRYSALGDPRLKIARCDDGDDNQGPNPAQKKK